MSRVRYNRTHATTAMTRRLLNLLTALSLMLCVAVGAMWVRSFYIPVAYRFHARGEWCEAVLTRGRVSVSNAPEVVAHAHRRGRLGLPATTPSTRAYWSQSSRAFGPVLIIFLAAGPALAARSWQDRRHSLRVGLCPSCGYDLRASPGRCPECGHAATR